MGKNNKNKKKTAAGSGGESRGGNGKSEVTVDPRFSRVKQDPVPKSKNENKKKKNKAATANGGDSGTRKVIEDPRFNRVHHDPRFQRVPKKEAKVKIDSRFRGMLKDKNFATSSTARVDKRGKANKKESESESALERYYHFDEDEDKDEKEVEKEVKLKLKEEREDESGSELDGGASEEDLSDSDTNSAESISDTDIDTDIDDEDGVEMIGDEASLEVENVPVIDKETHRLAVVNMDWSNIQAVDLFVMLSSCLPKGGQINSVTVYPSEFGLKRMEEEAVRGPVTLFEDEKKRPKDEDKDEGEDDESDDGEGDGEDDESDVDEGEDVDEESGDDEAEDVDEESGDEDDDVDEESGDEDDDDEEIDPEKLRAYEKSKLRYYFAVVDCDSVATADHLYKNCDGLEFERSSNVLDLRFIPDSMEFKAPIRDVATEAPANYEGLDFQTRALQQSNAVLSWDDDDNLRRSKTLRRNFTEKELAELDLKEFLASDDSEDESDEDGSQDPTEKKKKDADKYRALLLSGNTSENEDDKDQDMEVTFNTGLEDISKKILEKKDKGPETVFDAYLRKKKEKKKARKDKAKDSSDDDSDESDYSTQADDFFKDERPAGSSKKATNSKKNKETKKLSEDKETEASRAELELLLADENGTDKKPKGYKIKQKKAKGKKGDKAADEMKLPTVDIEDPRFSALYNNPGFALDPTDPQFKRSATYYRQLVQRQQKIDKGIEDAEPVEPSVRKEDQHLVNEPEKEKHELSAIVKSLKLKSQQLPVSSKVTVKNKMESNGSSLGKRKHKLTSSDHSMKKKGKLQG